MEKKKIFLTVATGTLTTGLLALLTDNRAVIEVVVAVVIIVAPVLEATGFGAGSRGVSDIKISPTCSL